MILLLRWIPLMLALWLIVRLSATLLRLIHKPTRLERAYRDLDHALDDELAARTELEAAKVRGTTMELCDERWQEERRQIETLDLRR
jgi:hypothetical protein